MHLMQTVPSQGLDHSEHIFEMMSGLDIGHDSRVLIAGGGAQVKLPGVMAQLGASVESVDPSEYLPMAQMFMNDFHRSLLKVLGGEDWLGGTQHFQQTTLEMADLPEDQYSHIFLPNVMHVLGGPHQKFEFSRRVLGAAAPNAAILLSDHGDNPDLMASQKKALQNAALSLGYTLVETGKIYQAERGSNPADVDVFHEFRVLKPSSAVQSLKAAARMASPGYAKERASWPDILHTEKDRDIRFAKAFGAGVDVRPVGFGLLDASYVAYDMEICRMANPDHRELVGVYGGAGVDASNFFLSTDATKAYFVDRQALSPEMLNYWKQHWEALNVNRFNNDEEDRTKYILGYSTVTDNAARGISEAEAKILLELKALGVDPGTLEIGGEGNEIWIEFMWGYQDREPVKRRITFINADITRPEEYPAVLQKQLISGIDIYFQRAGLAIPVSYDEFIPVIAGAMRQGGYFLTDDTAYWGTFASFRKKQLSAAIGEELLPDFVFQSKTRLTPFARAILATRKLFNPSISEDAYGFDLTVCRREAARRPVAVTSAARMAAEKIDMREFVRIQRLGSREPVVVIVKDSENARTFKQRRKSFLSLTQMSGELSRGSAPGNVFRELRDEVNRGFVSGTNFSNGLKMSRYDWRIDGFEPRGFAQNADVMVVAFVDHLDIFKRPGMTPARQIFNPKFRNLHSVYFHPGDADKILVSSAGADRILEVSVSGGSVVWEWNPWNHGYSKNILGMKMAEKKDLTATDKIRLITPHEAAAAVKSGEPLAAFNRILAVDFDKILNPLGLESWSKTAVPNYAQYADNGNSIFATLYEAGQVIRIDKQSGEVTVIADSLGRPHGFSPYGGGYISSDTVRGHVSYFDSDFNNVRQFDFSGLPAEPDGYYGEWIQNTTPIGNQGLLATIDSRRNKIFVWNPEEFIYSEYPFNPDWSFQEILPAGDLNAKSAARMASLHGEIQKAETALNKAIELLSSSRGAWAQPVRLSLEQIRDNLPVVESWQDLDENEKRFMQSDIYADHGLIGQLQTMSSYVQGYALKANRGKLGGAFGLEPEPLGELFENIGIAAQAHYSALRLLGFMPGGARMASRFTKTVQDGDHVLSGRWDGDRPAEVILAEDLYNLLPAEILEKIRISVTAYPKDWPAHFHDGEVGLLENKRTIRFALPEPVLYRGEWMDAVEVTGVLFNPEDLGKEHIGHGKGVAAERMTHAEKSSAMYVEFDRTGYPVYKQKEFAQLGGHGFESAKKKFERARGLLPRRGLRAPIALGYTRYLNLSKGGKPLGVFISMTRAGHKKRFNELWRETVRNFDIRLSGHLQANAPPGKFADQASAMAFFSAGVVRLFPESGIRELLYQYGRELRRSVGEDLTQYQSLLFPTEPHRGNFSYEDGYGSIFYDLGGWIES